MMKIVGAFSFLGASGSLLIERARLTADEPRIIDCALGIVAKKKPVRR